MNCGAIVDARVRARSRLHEAVPPHYSPWLHLLGTIGVGLGALAVALVSMARPTARELLTVPVTFLLANLVEWRLHRDVLHRRVPALAALYDRHTPEHHMVFGYDDMAIRDARELKLVLMPALGVAGVVLAVAPVAFGLSRLLGAGTGWLFLVSAALYVVLYEISHLAYHLPESSFLGRLRLVATLRELHRRHHHPRLMQRWNFNVTVPLGDLLHGTLLPREKLEETLVADRSRSSAER